MNKKIILYVALLLSSSSITAQKPFILEWNVGKLNHGRILTSGTVLEKIGGYYDTGEDSNGKKRKLGKYGIGFVIRIISNNGKRTNKEYGFVNFTKGSNKKKGNVIGKFKIPDDVPPSYKLPEGYSYYLCMVGQAINNGKKANYLYRSSPLPKGVKIIIK